uniref:Uncharacterized protein n=1 Tax=Aegilops tauschii subsp. strangulata TaxID=200361 RepID=A0A453RMI0_AEGTS
KPANARRAPRFITLHTSRAYACVLRPPRRRPTHPLMAATAAARGAASRSPLLLHHHRLPQVPAGGGGSLRVGALGAGRDWRRRVRVRVGVRVFARYSSQSQDFSSRLQDRAGELPKLVEDLLQTSISTGPRGAFRMAQGIQALLGVGGEWLNDFSKTANTSEGIPAQMRLGLLSPLYLRRLFERMGATYIKLVHSVCTNFLSCRIC